MLHDAFTAVPLQLMHPVLESLRNTDKQWLIDTLYAFNGGNVEKFQSYKSAWGQQVSHSISVTSTWSIKGWTENLWSEILSNEAKFYQFDCLYCRWCWVTFIVTICDTNIKGIGHYFQCNPETDWHLRWCFDFTFLLKRKDQLIICLIDHQLFCPFKH